VKQKAARPAQTDADSATVADLRHAVEELVIFGTQPEEEIMKEARRLANQWKIKLFPEDWPRPLFDSCFRFDETLRNTVLLLAGLVVAFSRDYQLLEQIRTHLEKVKPSNERFLADALAAYLPRIQTKLTPKQLYESKRRIWHLRVIEGEYSGAIEAPTCLDDIFNGGRVNMLRLQELFGMERHQFPKKLPSIRKGRETLYDYRAVATIMDALLSGRVRKKRKRSGRPPRMPWLNDPGLRTRVLNGIQARINGLSLKKHIKAAFLAVVSRHLLDSGEK
jgi:hypothetical protein